MGVELKKSKLKLIPSNPKFDKDQISVFPGLDHQDRTLGNDHWRVPRIDGARSTQTVRVEEMIPKHSLTG